MNNKEKLAFAVITTLALTGGGIAFGQTINPVSSDQVINACVTGVNGNITKVSNNQKTCPKGTTPISWNKLGPQGIPGIQGIQGPKGEQGVSYLDDFPVINGTDPNSFVLQVGRNVCMGGSSYFPGNETMYCAHQINKSGMLTFLDVEASGGYRSPSTALQFQILSGECPASASEVLAGLSTWPTGYLVSGTSPFGYTLSNQLNCVIIAAPNTADLGIYHVAVKVK